MQLAALQALEFDRVREALAEGAATALGRARCLALEPATDPAEVAARLNLTAEAVKYTKDGGTLSISAPEDLAALLQILEVAESPLDPLALLGLARFVGSVASVAARIGAVYPGLFAIAGRAASFDDEVRAIERAIHPSGDINDDASPALRELRDKLRRARARLRSSLENLVRGRDTAKYLQDEIITDRNGRYVVVVRAEFRDAIPGLIHGSSASGASLFLEPMTTVEANNEIVALVGREADEVRRILLSLTNAFRRRADDLEVLLDIAADLDELHARARFAARLDGIAPDLSDDGRLELRGARHPLLLLKGTGLARRKADPSPMFDSAVFDSRQAEHLSSGTGLPYSGPASSGTGLPYVGPASSGTGLPFGKQDPSPVVASDILITPPTKALIISGPNTGGKTVALKAAGLLAIMAQAGLMIPVDPGSRLTPFQSIFADIGDEQSIANSLSTFSGHIANIVEMDRALALPALVLLDEVGGGTDPLEGGALGVSVVDHFKDRGATVVATTHDDLIKSYAATTPGVMTAAFGFNPETYAPTYRLVYGAPGRSLALEIAERLGMPRSVVDAARGRRSERESLLSAHLARVDHELAEIEKERQAVTVELARVADRERQMIERETRVTEREAVLKRRLDDRLNEKLRDARQEVDQIVGRLKQKADVLTPREAASLSTGDLGRMRVEGRAALDAVGSSLGLSEASPDAGALAGLPSVGQTVFVSTFAADGIVRAVSHKDADIEIKGKRVRVPLAALRKHGAPESSGKAGASAPRPRPASQGRSSRIDSPETVRELVLIGQTVDAALDRAAKFLDDALLADEHRLRIVHGHGTGRLRDGVRAFFREHPLVASVNAAPDNEGGQAATIVELKD